MRIEVGAEVAPPEVVVAVPAASDQELAWSADQDDARAAADAEFKEQVDRIGGAA